jgi:hypothetical protein
MHNVAQCCLFRFLLQAHVINGDARIHPNVSAAFAAKAFPDLLQHGGSQPVQLYITVDTEDGSESASTAAGAKDCNPEVLWRRHRASTYMIQECISNKRTAVHSSLVPT